MAKVSPIQTSFAAGELSEQLAGRVDVPRYRNGLRTCLNYVPIVQGPITRRPGTKHVQEVKDSTKSTRLIPFEFSTEQAYVIELGDLYMRFYRNNARIVVTGVAAYNAGTTYAQGDLVVDVGINYYSRVSGNVGNTPASSATEWHALTDDIFEIPTVFLEADLFEINFSQSADFLYLDHEDHPPQELSRTGHTAWTINASTFLDGPYLNTNTSTTTLTPSGTTGSVTVTASAVTGINGDTGFQTTDVGRLIRFKDAAGDWSWLEITARASTTSVTATINGPDLSATTGGVDWRLGVWSDTTGYPSTVTFFGDRLFHAGGSADPARIDGSNVADYLNYAPSDADGVVTEAHAISVTLLSNKVNAIRWMIDDPKGLVVGTTGGEWTVSPAVQNQALSTTNIQATRDTNFGGAAVAPARAGNSILFVQKAVRKIRELRFVFDSDGFEGADLSVLSDHLTKTGFVELEFQKAPHPIIWLARTDGQLIGLTYDREQEAIAWHQHQIGGTSDAAGTKAKVESVAVIPNSTDTADELWLVVQRWVNGAAVRHVEYVTDFWEDGDVKADAFFVDSGVTYDGVSTVTITGLTHLEGETVTILADGATHPDKVVASGQITLDRAALKAQVGYGYNSDAELLRIEAGAADGTSVGKTQRIHNLHVMLWQTLGMESGPDEDNLDLVIFRSASDPMDASAPLATGTFELPHDGPYGLDERILLRQNQPLPGTILAVMPQLHTQDR